MWYTRIQAKIKTLQNLTIHFSLNSFCLQVEAHLRIYNSLVKVPCSDYADLFNRQSTHFVLLKFIIYQIYQRNPI
jgi:hypothetical protein